MTIFAIKGPDNKEMVDKVYQSIYSGYSRFGWGFQDEQSLHKLQNKAFTEMTKEGKEAWKFAKFLLEVKNGDWVVHINVPEWGKCIAAKVIGEYAFDSGVNLKDHDFKRDLSHKLKVDPETILKFDRNAPEIPPAISKRLKLQGSSWKIHDKESWEKAIKNLQGGEISINDEDTKELYYLKDDLEEILKQFIRKVHENHPRKKLEEFVSGIFQNVPNIEEVKVTGSGWGTDHGADLVATVKEGLDISGFLEQKTLVAQVKSYEGEINDQNAINQIQTAIDKYDADYGLIVTTAEAGQAFLDKVDKASKERMERDQNDLKTPAKISVLAGENLAKFFLKYGSNKLFESA